MIPFELITQNTLVSNKQLAEYLQISQATIEKVKAGNRRGSNSTIRKLQQLADAIPEDMDGVRAARTAAEVYSDDHNEFAALANKHLLKSRRLMKKLEDQQALIWKARVQRHIMKGALAHSEASAFTVLEKDWICLRLLEAENLLFKHSLFNAEILQAEIAGQQMLSRYYAGLVEGL